MCNFSCVRSMIRVDRYHVCCRAIISRHPADPQGIPADFGEKCGVNHRSGDQVGNITQPRSTYYYLLIFHFNILHKKRYIYEYFNLI